MVPRQRAPGRPAGRGQQSMGQTLGRGGSRPIESGGASWRYSLTSSRTMVTKRGWVPAVAAQALVQIPSHTKFGAGRRLDRSRPQSRCQRGPPNLRHRRPCPAQFAKFELPFLDLLRQFDTSDHNGRRLKALESQHRPQSMFHPAMALGCQSVQTAANEAHSNRSAAVSFGRCTERCRTPS